MMTSVTPARCVVHSFTHGLRDNELLTCLPAITRRLWENELELAELEQGQLLHESDGRIPYAYFPLTAVVANLYSLKSGGSAEIALIGNEGMVGFPLVLGGESTPSRAVALVAGEAWRVNADFIQRQSLLTMPVMHLMLRFLQAMMTQMTQTAVCNRYHSIEQQLCRWLLLVLDRLPVSEFAVTQELVAIMLGVRRESVTAAAGHLQAAGLIRYTRGRVAVVDREGLEQRSCECYQVVRHEYARLLPHRLATA